VLGAFATVDAQAELKSQAVEIQQYGGDVTDSKQVLLQGVLGFRGGQYVDQISVNSEAWGGEGGHANSKLELGDNEYVNEVELHYGNLLDFIKVTTSKGRSISVGGSGGHKKEVLKDIRLLSLGASSQAGFIKGVELRYIKNYQPSKEVTSNARCIVSFLPPETERTEYEEATVRELRGLITTWEQSASRENVVIQEEFIAEAKLGSVGQGVGGDLLARGHKTSNRDDWQAHIKQRLQDSQDRASTTSGTTKTKVPKGAVAVEVVTVKIMQGADGKFWVLPTTGSSWIIKNIETEWSSFLGCYDLTGKLDAQVSGLKAHRKERHSFMFYE